MHIHVHTTMHIHVYTPKVVNKLGFRTHDTMYSGQVLYQLSCPHLAESNPGMQGKAVKQVNSNLVVKMNVRVCKPTIVP